MRPEKNNNIIAKLHDMHVVAASLESDRWYLLPFVSFRTFSEVKRMGAKRADAVSLKPGTALMTRPNQMLHTNRTSVHFMGLESSFSPFYRWQRAEILLRPDRSTWLLLSQQFTCSWHHCIQFNLILHSNWILWVVSLNCFIVWNTINVR